jgi:hypothetical protein
MPGATLCAYGDRQHEARPEHEHPYEVRNFGARRCTCGCTKWKIKTGSPLGLSVTCTRCSRLNYSATAYETGRHDGIPRSTDAASHPPF